MIAAFVARAMAGRGIHYGWFMAGLVFLAGLCESAAMSVPSVLLTPMSNDLGWSLSELSGRGDGLPDRSRRNNVRADFGQNEMAVRMISDMVTRRYDHRTLAQWLGREAPVIALGHTVPFFADRLFEQFVAEGVQFIPLEEAVADPAYEQVGRVASDKFLIYQQKLADLSGRSLPSVAPEIQHLHEKVLSDAAGPLRRPKV